jgi:hypothetical protein
VPPVVPTSLGLVFTFFHTTIDKMIFCCYMYRLYFCFKEIENW